MRIVGGTLGGRRIAVPKRGVRPTSERVREALMSVLGPDWAGRRVLDCFAGSGAFGFEALSRGAASVLFVDSSVQACDHLARAAERLGVTERVDVRRAAASETLSRLARQGAEFDVLFFDPPWSDGRLPEILGAAAALVAAGARVVAEHEASERLADRVGALQCIDRRTYGRTGVAIYVVADPADPADPVEET